MPHSPFTRFLATVIVALYALALLWPDDRAYVWGWYAMASLPIILGVFTWSAVRSAAPFDDRSFHRILPPGDGHAFFRVLWIHLLVLAGISLAVLIHCWSYNFGWQAMTYGIAMLTIPVWAFISATGLACSLASSTQHWRSMGWIAIFAMPLFSWAMMYWARSGFDPEWPNRDVYFPQLRGVVLAAAGLYPLIWWLAAVARKRGLGILFGSATGALLPWLYVYGGFVKAPSSDDLYKLAEKSQERISSTLKLTRKPLPENPPPWIPISDLLSAEGLAEGDFVYLTWFLNPPDVEKRAYMPTYEVRDEMVPENGGVRYVELTVQRSNGVIGWGQDSFWQGMRSQFPGDYKFEYWDRSLNRPSSPLVVMKPGRVVNHAQGPHTGERMFGYKNLTLERFKSEPWTIRVLPPAKWQLLGESETTHGKSFRLPHGGVIKMMPLELEDGGHFKIKFRHFDEELWQADGPWFGDARRYQTAWTDLRIVIADDASRTLFAVDALSYGQNSKIMLGRSSLSSFDAGANDSPEQTKRIEMLRHARVYVFLMEAKGPFEEFELPPP